MDFFSKLFDKGASGGTEICPSCGSPMDEAELEGKYVCQKSHHIFWKVNGKFVEPFSPEHLGRTVGTCESCQRSLSGGETTLPWEDGNNANAYIKCPHCGHKNIKDGYG
jgi:DNA-directed RNA polymerase subunit RPC12/RpoP